MKELESIKLRLSNKDPEIRINALFDAYEYDTEGINLVIQALADESRKVRQAALIFLAESKREIARQALWNYLPFSKMQCLYTIDQFKFDSFNTEQFHPDYFAIANYNNTLVSYWDTAYKASGVAVWDLKTGNLQKNCYLMAHEFGLGQNGKVFITSFQDLLYVFESKTLEQINNDRYQFMCDGCQPEVGAFAVCATKKPLIAKGDHMGGRGNLEIWNYQTFSLSLNYEFEHLLFFPFNSDLYHEDTRKSSLFFTPDGDFLIASFLAQEQRSLIKIWDTETTELVQTVESLSKLTITSVGMHPDGTIIACGIREGKVCAWELQTDKIIYSNEEMSPCILSDDGRVLIYATDKHEIVVRDLVSEQELCRLTGHNAPIAYITLSTDYEFIASYSTDKQIKIWGMANLDLK